MNERVRRTGWIVAIALVGGLASDFPGVKWGRTSSVFSEEPEARRGEGGSRDPLNRLREGFKLSDEPGGFRRSGDYIFFHPRDGSPPLRALENLALERIDRALKERPSLRAWVVSGTVTEYHGENFLLVTRAVMSPASTPRLPTRRPAGRASSRPGA